MTPPAAIPLTDVALVDLDRHAVIEASAGTGKTYTIERLVVRLIAEKALPIESLLIVTYTEKATGELQERIRGQLAEAIAGGNDSPALRQAFDNFDSAAIHTIHGFCQRVLRQFAFENGESFDQELVDDGQVYERQLHEIMRRDWPARYGDALPELLALADYPGTTYGASPWEQQVCRLAQIYHPQCGDLLLPEPRDLCLDAARTALRKHLDRLLPLAGHVDAEAVHRADLYRQVEGLPYSKASHDKILSAIVIPLLQLLAAHRPPGGASLRAWFAFISACESYGKTFMDKRFRLLLSALTKAAKDTEHQPAVRNLEAIVDQLSALDAAIDRQGMPALLAVETVNQLRHAVRRRKAERGWISYDDMLNLVRDALCPETNPRSAQLLGVLRHRYRYALVDEFQDTDPVQWDIFRRIFLGSEEQRLFLIGDPKQAIYSFRGADVDTYLRARDHLLADHGAARYTLPVNYRARPELIALCNRLFSCPAWFAPDAAIPFEPVGAPPVEPHKLARDRTRRPPIVAVALPDDLKARATRQQYAAFIAAEIAALLRSPSPLQLYDKAAKTHRDLRADDICLLVRSRHEATMVEETLAAANLPTSYYKKPGVYESTESLHLLYLLEALAAPDDPAAFSKALLTRFFAIAPADLPAFDLLPSHHPVRELFDRWTDFAAERDWPRLFQSLLDDSGILYRDIAATDGERRVTNYRHLLQDLYLAAGDESLDIAGVARILRRRRERGQGADQDGDLHRLETERPKIKVMTIHASKGLEFPVVFLAGGFGDPRRGEYYRFHRDGRLIYDLATRDEHRPLHDAESDDEDRRLFYVALTRASHRLYLPLRGSKGFGGPVTTFIYEALQQDGLPDPVVPGDILVPEPLSEEPPAVAPVLPPLPDPLLPVVDIDLARRLRPVTSFSGLHRQPGEDGRSALATAADAQQRVYDRPGSRPDDELAPADDRLLPPAHLPPGAQTGSLLHDLLERVDYPTVAAASDADALLTPGSATAQLIDDGLSDYQLHLRLAADQLAERRRHVAQLLHVALTTPLDRADLRLGHLPAADRLHELEFYFPAPLHAHETLPRGIQLRHGYIHGYIDLFFRYRGAYYLLDWKSNLLDSYTPDALARAMDEADYHLQHRLYRIAVDRWLRPRLGDYRFGGVYYLFLRGLNGQDATTGVYFAEP